MTSSPKYSGLLTDLYELTMAAGYLETGFDARATFELFVRSLPPRRNYLAAAGLDQALDFLENVRFSDEEIAYARKLPVFAHTSGDFFNYLAQFHFSGDVWAMPEGTIFFPGEPILRVTAPIVEAQIVETFLLATINFQTMIASKAARITQAADGRPVIEFGTRRAHGIESGVLAARAAIIGGCQGTSNVAAGHQFGIPVYGTQAHSWIMAYEDEAEAFQRFLDIFPDHAGLLVDTYDVRAAVEKIISAGRKPRGVRLDSGDLAGDSAWARARLDQAGWKDVIVFASGDLDEDRIFSFGGEVRSAAKFSAAKVTYPGRKQVYRFSHKDGNFAHDVIGLMEEKFPGAETLLEPVMVGGKRTAPRTDLDAARRRCLQQRALLPKPVRDLNAEAATYPVRHSERLEALLEQVRRRVQHA